MSVLNLCRRHYRRVVLLFVAILVMVYVYHGAPENAGQPRKTQSTAMAPSVFHSNDSLHKFSVEAFTEQFNKYAALDETKLKPPIWKEGIRIGQFTFNGNASQRRFTLGDVIRVDMRLCNQFLSPLTEGGDMLRIWMREPGQNASASGEVIDHKNGTYTGLLPAAWTGRPVLYISVSHTKEHLGLYVKFFRTWGYRLFLDAANHEMPVDKATEEKVFNNEKRKLFNWAYMNIFNDTIEIVQARPGQNRLSSPTVSCNEIPARLTWTEDYPTGFMYQNEWISYLCNIQITQNPQVYFRCYNNRHVIFLGDSTTRHWLTDISTFLHLPVQQGWEHYHRLFLYNRDTNLSMETMSHVPTWAHAPNIYEIPKFIDKVPANSKTIVVLHWFQHIARCCNYTMFYDPVTQTKQALIRMFRRAPEVKVIIKTPHGMGERYANVPWDFSAWFIQVVLYDVLHDLKDRILFLNVKDLTVSELNTSGHPSHMINYLQIHMMTAYICNA